MKKRQEAKSAKKEDGTIVKESQVTLYRSGDGAVHVQCLLRQIPPVSQTSCLTVSYTHLTLPTILRV